MTVANMIIVEVKQYNDQKRADRLLQNEFVIYQGRIGIVRAVEFSDDAKRVMVTMDITHKAAQLITDTVSTDVPRDAIFTTVQMVSK